MKIIQTDCLVIGSGAAGSTYALEAASRGLDCVVLCAGAPEESNSWLAQGGVILPQPGDEKTLFKDILNASANTADQEVIKEFISKGNTIMREQILNLVPFDKTPGGDLDLTTEAAHSVNRVVHAKDSTGKTLTQSLWNELNKKVEVKPSKVVIDLLTLSHSSRVRTDKYKPSTCIGAYVFDTETNEVSAILAQRTILATGGLGQVFSNTTNHANAYGHGISMAYRIGARIMDMEFVQFHPTVLKLKNSAQHFLISESMRGEGARFINSNGQSFMDKIHPDGSLAPRDIIARSVFFEMTKTSQNNVYLDTSKVSKLKERFPHIYSHCKDHGVDITKNPIPVAPAAHYLCGGIYTDINGNTSIQGLKAIGETACTGLHGANRLASTSLLECLVMGASAAEYDANEIKTHKQKFPKINDWEYSGEIADMDLIQQDLNLIKNTMWNYVGLVRTKKRLHRAQKVLSDLKIEVDQFYAHSQLSLPLLNLRAAIQSSLLVVYAALRNSKSQGCHYRHD